MLKMYLPARRLPFGFSGDWGKVYKRFVDDISDDISEDYIYEDCHYVEIGADIQFKRASDNSKSNEQPMESYITKVENIVVETTDSYWDDKLRMYRCCVSTEDIIDLYGKRWVVESIQEKRIGQNSFYYCKLKTVMQDLRRNNVKD